MTQDFDTPATLQELKQDEPHLAELNALMEASTVTPAQSDDMFDLEKLLNESLSRKADEKRIKEARRSLSQGGITPAERQAMREMVQDWELKREWNPKFNTLMLDVLECTHCGSKHKHFVGTFQQQEHKTSKVTRWVTSGVVCQLPKNLKENVTHVGICSDCADMQGWEGAVCGHE